MRQNPPVEARPKIGLLGFPLPFTDTAAAINCLDLVVAVDTSFADVACALGKFLFLLLAYETNFC